MGLWFPPWEPGEGGESQWNPQRAVCTVETGDSIAFEACFFLRSSTQREASVGKRISKRRQAREPPIFLIIPQGN